MNAANLRIAKNTVYRNCSRRYCRTLSPICFQSS